MFPGSPFLSAIRVGRDIVLPVKAVIVLVNGRTTARIGITYEKSVPKPQIVRGKNND